MGIVARLEDAMPLSSALAITLTAEQRAALECLVRAHGTPQQLALRARVILLGGTGVRATARALGIEPRTVRHWRQRWLSRTGAAAERLADAPRAGAPATFTAEQVCAIIALACEPPSASGRPITHWSPASWRARRSDAAWQRGLRSARWGACLKEADLKPHRLRPWLTPKPDPDFRAKCADCAVYHSAATTSPEGATRTVSIDEMTGVQALERIVPSLPPRPGKVERQEFEYRRHGTQTLIASFDVATGKVQGTIGNRRTEQDFAGFSTACLQAHPTPPAGTSSATTSTSTSRRAWSGWSPAAAA